jgi:hypothetical protein
MEKRVKFDFEIDFTNAACSYNESAILFLEDFVGLLIAGPSKRKI